MDGNWTLLGARDGQSPSLGDTQLAFVIANYDANIWMLDPATGVSSPQALVSSSKYDSNPNWSPDGSYLLATRYDETGQNVIRVALNQREVTVIPTSGEHPYGNQVSADGSWLYYVASMGGGGNPLVIFPHNFGHEVKLVVDFGRVAIA
jgi:Tol biopolymer transport system component